MAGGGGPTPFELLGIGATAAGCIAIGVVGGYWIGSASRVGVVAVFGGLAVGLVAALAATYFKIKQYL
ncbi:MAG: hypothetical protein M0014_09445 [Actinomycetota bacterium]|jgi:hypothetical protein|nr:hypothetical protein [Actinomycetota bacterium]